MNFLRHINTHQKALVKLLVIILVWLAVIIFTAPKSEAVCTELYKKFSAYSIGPVKYDLPSLANNIKVDLGVFDTEEYKSVIEEVLVSFTPYARHYTIETLGLAIAIEESGLQPNIHSPSGRYYGLYQISSIHRDSDSMSIQEQTDLFIELFERSSEYAVSKGHDSIEEALYCYAFGTLNGFSKEHRFIKTVMTLWAYLDGHDISEEDMPIVKTRLGLQS